MQMPLFFFLELFAFLLAMLFHVGKKPKLSFFVFWSFNRH